MRLFVNMPESFGPYLHPGLTADVTVPQLPNRHFTAKFLTVARGFDPDMRTAVTEFTIDNEDKALWPDSYATVRLTVPTNRTALTIPSSAMVFQEHGTQVAVVTEDDRVHFKAIAVGKILTGSDRGDRGDFHKRPHYDPPQCRVARRQQSPHRHASDWLSPRR